MNRFPALLLAAFCALPLQAQDAGSAWNLAGHAKYRFIGYTYPDNSLFREELGSTAIDQGLEARLKFAKHGGRWDFQADYQLIGMYADTLQLAGSLPGGDWLTPGIITDDRRWFNLTWTLADSGQGAVVHRFDRATIGYTTEHWVWRFGRQAVSWGNGLMFSPMDIFNPFDPAAVDTEYKSGDDMLYGQYLFADGSDLQGVAVVRRDPRTGDVEQNQSSLAFKYHGFVGMNEYDLLVSEHYDDLVLGLGGSMGVGGAVWRGDLTWTSTDRDNVLSAVTSLSYSWVWNGKNVSGVLEYYHNGFGQSSGDYSPVELLSNPGLLRRIERGELFTLSKNYVAASASIEMTPLFMLVPNLFVNVDDPSALLQLVVRYDWQQDLQLLGALNLPVGASGTEYGGIETMDERYYSSGPGLFIQLAWYF
jgi:hypothetical protein